MRELEDIPKTLRKEKEIKFGGLLGSSGSNVRVWSELEGVCLGVGVCGWVTRTTVGVVVLRGLLFYLMCITVGPITQLCAGRRRGKMDDMSRVL